MILAAQKRYTQAMERITAINITSDLDAPAALRRPQVCGQCGGRCFTFELVEGVTLFGLPLIQPIQCPGCNGVGESMFISWN